MWCGAILQRFSFVNTVAVWFVRDDGGRCRVLAVLLTRRSVVSKMQFYALVVEEVAIIERLHCCALRVLVLYLLLIGILTLGNAPFGKSNT